MKKYDAIIIGGGISGLNIAYKLSKKGKKIVLIEKEKELGGMLRSLKKDNYSLEEFYHHIFQNNSETIKFIEELGLANKLIWSDASTGFYYKNKFYKLTVPMDLLYFKPLTFIEKIVWGLFVLKIKLTKSPGKLDNLSAEQFIIKNSNKAVYNKFFKPLLSAKYGKNLDKISAAWFVERINMRNKRGYKGEILGYIKNGFGVLIQELEKRIKSNGGEILKGTAVSKIKTDGVKAVSITFGNTELSAENFISTIPGPSLAKLAAFPKGYSRKLESLINQGTICVILGVKKKLTDFYWTNLIKEDISFRAIIEHTNFQPVKEYGEHIIYLASYPDQDTSLWKLSDKQLFGKYFKDLQSIVNISPEDVNWFKVIREANAGLVYSKGILNKILPITTPFKNLYIAGMLNSYPDRNIEQSLILSNKILNLILK